MARSDPPAERPRHVRNVFSNWGGFVFSAVVSLALTPFIIRTLGDTQYGVWVLLGSLVGYLGLLDLGVRGAVTRYVAHFHAAARHEETGRLASAALASFTAAGTVAMLLAGVLALVATRLFTIPPELAGVARIVILLAGASIGVGLVGGVYGGIVVGRHRFDYLNAIGVVTTALRAVLIVVVLRAGMGLVALAVIQLAVAVLTTGAQAVLSRRLYPELVVRLTGWSLADARQVFAFGLFASVLHISQALATYTDSIVIGAFLPVGVLTFYAIAASLTQYARQVVSGISQPVMPVMGALSGGPPEAVAQTLIRASRLATLVLMPIVITLLLRGESFVALWVGPDHAVRTGPVLRVLVVALWPFAAYQVLTSAAVGLDRHRGLAPAFVLDTAVNLVLSIALVRPLGIVGVAWGTAIPRLAVCLVFGPWYASRRMGVPARAYVIQTWVLPALAMIPFALGTYAVESWWPAGHVFGFFGQVALTLPLAAVGAWLVGLAPDDRRVVARSLPRALRSAAGA